MSREEKHKGLLYNPWVLGVGTALLAGIILQALNKYGGKTSHLLPSNAIKKPVEPSIQRGGEEQTGTNMTIRNLEENVPGIGVIAFGHDGYLDRAVTLEVQRSLKEKGITCYGPANFQLNQDRVKVGEFRDQKFLKLLGMPNTKKLLMISSSKTITRNLEPEDSITTELKLTCTLTGLDSPDQDIFFLFGRGIGFSEQASLDNALALAVAQIKLRNSFGAN